MKIELNNKNKVRLSAFALASTIMLSGCATEMSNNYDKEYDVLDTNENYEDGLTRGVKQVIPVNGEDFSLVVIYNCPAGDDWRITSDKSLYIEIYTEGLSDDKEVYIDNIHTDTSIMATNAYFDGIIQDTCDDRIHNSLMLGFPISDTQSYYGINKIEGQNSEFVRGYGYGYSGYTSVSVDTRRYLESHFLEKGVYANKISSAIGLLIVDKATGRVLRGVDVNSDIQILVNNRITFKNKDTYVTYEYDRSGARRKVEEIDASKYEEESALTYKLR